TDGVTEAQNLQDDFFGDRRLLAAAQDNLSASALVIQDTVLAAVDDFSDVQAPCDDESLVIVKRQ
ncbi:MAG: SpoIIE family protein phosphatase, partial [Anaerolineaceae bacterium]